MILALASLSLFVPPQGTPPVLNAPVAPDAIYLARRGASAGLSILDLNGFGGGTGNPAYDIQHPIVQGNTNFPNNPNLALQGAVLVPALGVGFDTRTGGSSGVFTLSRNSDLDDVFGHGARIVDLMLGQPLDLLLHADAGCIPCAEANEQRFAFAPPHALVPALGTPIHSASDQGNPISWAPHPNPPPLLTGTPCDPRLDAAEPTSILSALAPPTGRGLTNLLVPGPLPLGIPSIGLPPQGMLASQQNAFFVGPDPSAVLDPRACQPSMIRQQIGHVLYAIERHSRSLLALNSNRMTLLATIPLGDPVELAMSPDLTRLAITDRLGGRVDFLDIDPRSPAFHRIVASTPVGRLPLGIAWDPGAEDVLVCNEGDGTLSILSAATLKVRKTVTGLDHPFAVAITPRQDQFGLQRNVYFAYVLERSGRVVLFESGPDGPGGWGFDAPILRTRYACTNPRAIQPDPTRLAGGVWIAHENPLDGDGHFTGQTGGALTNLTLVGSAGARPLLPGERPHARELGLRIERSLGEGANGLSGIPLDLAFDDQNNLGALRNYHTPFSAGAPAEVNGKNLVRFVPGQGVLATQAPAFVFVPTSAGVVDVLALATGQRVDTDAFQPGLQSIPAPGVWHVMSYFRQ